MKKLLAILLAIVMVMGLATTAMAATTGTVKNDTNRAYKAYQIFSGTQATDNAVLGDVAWGSGIDDTAFLTALTALKIGESTPFATCTTAADVAAVLKDVADKSETAKAFANLAEKHVDGDCIDVAANATTTLDSGYYLLVDQTSVDGNYEAKNPALLQVTNDSQLNITDKSGKPTVDKTIQGEGEAAEGSIDDTFTFVLTATMPATFEGYDTYKVVFHDTLSKGLTYNKDAQVSVAGFDTEFSIDANGVTTITITNYDVLDNGVAAGSSITVTYTATLNAGAVIGGEGNPNTVKLEYSNDPDWDGTLGSDDEPTGETPEDKVVVFTFELDVTKVDGENAETKLADAEFKLQNEAGNWVAVDESGKVTGWVASEEEVSVLKSDAEGKFAIVGLDVGKYKLHETKAPAGYNLLVNPIEIEIIATITDNEETQTLDALKIKVDGEEANGNVTTGIVETTVENNSGATLPETGGMGTTLFYILGGVLVLAAVVLLVTKRRMNAAE